ncbi:sugar transporter [Mollisia scopiformis]|uniref:Sugar transporter n=1 Tax=Mollisia scopiformis TaxID=149040 RepID=A0A194X5X7_MOLSC|nr:sugar transporter [Mollisia scopiformis]KUJ15586.1 sugar transporter [Mollisia scopiformis]
MKNSIDAAAGAQHGDHSDKTIQVDVEDSVVQKLAVSSSKFVLLSSEAKEASDAEHAMTVRQAVKLYPEAIFWSVLLSTAVAQEGYDSVLISAFYAFPVFTKKYGERKPGGTSYQIPAPWQAGVSNGARVGEILGLFVNGIVSDRFGFKKTMIGTLALLTALIFIPFCAQNIETLEVGEILMGIPWGVFQTLTTAYAAEVCPVALRGYLTTYVNMMWGFGQLLASGVVRSQLTRTDESAYRIPFALQWMWPIPLLVGIAFAPESPWWLVRKGRYDDARKALGRLSSTTSESKLDNTVSMMRHTNELEKEISAGTTYRDCFKGDNLRRTEITCITWVIQAASGASLMGYAAYFFEQAGLPTSIAFDFSISVYAVAMIGVVISWFVMTYLGRRTIYLGGLSCMVLVLLTIGFVSIKPSKGTSFATGGLLLLFTLFYDITIGTVAYSIVAEMPSSRLRTKTIVLARNLYNVQGIINGIITPYMLNPDAWNWKGKAGFFWAGMGSLCLLWTYLRLPEPKRRTFAELDILFEQKVSAREFKSAVVDPFKIHHSSVDGIHAEENQKKE